MSVREVVVRLSANTSGYIAGMGRADAANAKTVAGLRRIQGHGLTTEKAVDRIGKASGRAFVAGAAAIGYAEKKAADFNAEMATVATLSHANAREYTQLAQAAKTVGVNIGYSATQSANAEQELIKAGVSLKDIMGGGLKGALDLAAAGQTDVATATEVAASAMTQFKLQGKDVPHIADLLAAGADKALGSVTDLGYGLSQSGTTAHQMGLSIEATTGTLAEFAQNGLIGERGGTTFKMMLLRLANPTKKSAELMDEYNLSIYKANGQLKTMPEIAGNLQRSFQKLDPAQRNAALGTIFGSRAIQAANILIKEGEAGNRRWIKSVDDQGFAAQQASGKMNSLKGDLAKLKAQLDNAFINASGRQNFLRELAQDGTKLLKVYNNLSDGQRDLFTKSVVRGTEFAGAIYGATKLYKLVKSTGQVLDWATGAGGVSKALGGGVLGKATRGVTPVFVTNPGFGKGGADVSAGGSRVRRQAERNASRSTASRAAEDGAAATAGSVRLAAVATAAAVAGGIFAGRKFNAYATGSGDHNLKKDAKLASSYEGRNAIGKGLAKANDLLNNTDYGKAVENIKKLDAQLAKEAKLNPGRAMTDYQKALDKTGMSAEQLNKILPKTAEAMNPNTGAWAGNIAKTVQSATPGVVKFKKVLDTIPKDIRSYVSTPGAALSVASMSRLRNEYHLTPKQVRTVMQLQGFSDTQIRIVNAGKAFRSLPRQVKTALRADTVKSVADVRRLQRVYNLTPAQKSTVMKVSGVDAAIAKVHALRVEIAGVRDKSVTITEIRRGDKAKSPGLVGHPSADGSTVPKTGRGYADRHHYLLADGEEVTSNRWGQADRYRPVLKAINADLPREQIKAMLAAGGTAGRLAGGGTTTYSTGPGVTVTFPAPAVYTAAVSAADKIAVAGAKYAATAAEVRGTRLDDLHLQQQIVQTQKSLAEKDTRTVKGKDGKKHKVKGYSLTGIDRTVAAAELADEKAQLVELRKQSAVAKQLADARAEALEAIRQARSDAQAAFSGATDVWGRGSSGTAFKASIDRETRDLSQYGQNIAALRSKGASPALLQLVNDKAQSGDFTSANRLAKSLLESPLLLSQVNASVGARDAASAAAANIITDPRFLGTGSWNPTGAVPQVNVNVGANPDSWMLQLRRTITHEVGVQLAQAVS